jgi:TolB-like protein
MLRLALGLMLATSATSLAAGSQKIKVAFVPLKAMGGVKQDVANLVTIQLAAEIQSRGFSVMSPDDLQAKLGFDRQKELLGCTDANCLVEIGAALGVDRLVSGTIAHIGNSVVINLALINEASGNVDFRYSERVKEANDEAFLDLVPKAVNSLFPDVKAAVVEPPAAATGGHTAAKVTLGLGIGLAVVAGGLWAWNGVEYSMFKSGTNPNAGTLGPIAQGSAIAASGLAAAALVTSIILFTRPDAPAVSAALVPMPGGAAFTLGGQF